MGTSCSQVFGHIKCLLASSAYQIADEFTKALSTQQMQLFMSNLNLTVALWLTGLLKYTWQGGMLHMYRWSASRERLLHASMYSLDDIL